MANQKRDGRELFNNGLIVMKRHLQGCVHTNVLGPFGVPFYNSVISTFSYSLPMDLSRRSRLTRS
jgi:UDP-2-acetamido-2,6-beta-L-arabino-hexul-4-ose reductase